MKLKLIFGALVFFLMIFNVSPRNIHAATNCGCEPQISYWFAEVGSQTCDSYDDILNMCFIAGKYDIGLDNQKGWKIKEGTSAQVVHATNENMKMACHARLYDCEKKGIIELPSYMHYSSPIQTCTQTSCQGNINNCTSCPSGFKTCFGGYCTTTYKNSASSTPSPKPSEKTADANGDRKVNGVDYVIWLNHYNQNTNQGPKEGDFNNDGKVDGLDYVIWVNNFN